VQSDTFADWVVTSPGGTNIAFKKDAGRCDRFPFVDLNDPEVIELFGEIREEHVKRLKEEVMSEHFKYPRPYHGNMSFFGHEGPPTAEDYLTDEENEVGPVIGGHGCYDREILNNSVVLLESKRMKQRLRTQKWTK
jgi:hypothetical protein